MMQVIILIIIVILVVFGITAFVGAPYVPSQKAATRQAFSKLYRLSSTDTVIDLGSGDGVVLRVAREYGAKAIGVELNPIMNFLSRIITPGAKIVMGSYYRYQFPKETTVVYTFADSRDLPKIYRKVEEEAQRLQKRLYLISLAFDMEGVTPIKKHGAYLLYEINPI